MKEIQEIKNDIMLLKNLGNITKEVELVLLRKLTSLEKQLTIGDVVSSLPSKEEMEIKLNFFIENKPESFNKYDEITFKFGFRTCFYWLEKKLKK